MLPPDTDGRAAQEGLPEIEISPIGNLANRMIQYLAAVKLARRLGGARISGVSLPEWGLVAPAGPRPAAPDSVYEVNSWQLLDVSAIAALIGGPVQRIVLKAVLQRMEFFDSLDVCRAVFRPPDRGDEPKRLPRPDELVVSVRAAEILDGVRHYPLVPIGFMREILALSGLRPVFIGQLEPSFYCEALYDAFPDATFIPTMGPVADFEFLRGASHILPSISTFAWLAAWLSQARSIYLPVSGMLNPAHMRSIDLLPDDDPRYRFFLFPLNFGLPEREALAHHRLLEGRWREVSRSQIAVLKRAAPLIAQQRLGARFDFDGVWYAHTYPEAARELSDGWFSRPLDHFLEVGRLRGYRPTPPAAALPAPSALPSALPNVAAGCPATQSSLSRSWARHASREEDAATALSGEPTGDYSFHTTDEYCPWWQVDLRTPHAIAEIVVHNRIKPPQTVGRAAPLAILRSDDGRIWRMVLRTPARQTFGGADGNPLRCPFDPPIVARFIRLSLTRRNCLHLDKVEVRGTPIAAAPAQAAIPAAPPVSDLPDRRAAAPLPAA